MANISFLEQEDDVHNEQLQVLPCTLHDVGIVNDRTDSVAGLNQALLLYIASYCFVLNLFIHLPNSLRLITCS